MLQSLKTFSALCLGLVMQAALGQPTHFQHFGNFQRMMHSGDTAGQVALSKLDQSPSRWGVVSHLGERFHVHYIDDSQTVSGHVDQYNVRSGATLWLPVR